MSRSVYEVQRDFALSSGLRSEIIWDSLAPDQSDILKQKIKTLIPDGDKTQDAIEKMRRDLFQNIWLQRKYTNRTLLSAIIYIMVTDEKDKNLANQATTFSCHPVFRTRKCMNSSNSAGCCMIFIDEFGRVYKNWRHYVLKNVLPRGTMIAPANGRYTFNNDNQVELEHHYTPLSGTKSQILNTADTVAGVGGLIATMPIAAALMFPLTGPVMVAATSVAITSAAYSTLRSAMQLNDRYQHGQSMAPTDRVARKNWLGVAGGVVGLGATGATKALTCAAAAGQEITLVTKIAVNGITVSSILLSGTGIVNGVYDLYMNKDDNPCGMDLLHLASSLLVFTHSINNLKIASRVLRTNRTSSMRNELRNHLRNSFDKISRETAKLRGSNGNFDVIRTVNDIPFKDALMSLHKINAHLQGGGTATALTAVAATILPNSLLNLGADNAEVDMLHLAEEFGFKFVQHIANPSSLLDVLKSMAKYLCEKVFRLLMNLARIFIEENVEAIDRTLKTFVSTETIVYKIFMHCVKKYSNFSYEFLESQTGEILQEVETFFISLNPINDEDRRSNCPVCKGYFYICTL